MFEVKRDEKVSKTFRIPVSLLKQLEIVAQEKKVSMNYLVVQCCEYALQNIEGHNAKNGETGKES